MARRAEELADATPDDGGEPPAGVARLVRRWFWLALLPLGLGLLLFDGGLLEQRRLQRSLDSLAVAEQGIEREIERLKDLNRRLAAGEPFAVEAEARRLGMARPGDEVWRVMLDADTLEAGGRRP